MCLFAEGEVDRSPTCTGVIGRLAIHHARGEVESNQRLVVDTNTFGLLPAVIVSTRVQELLALLFGVLERSPQSS